MSTTSEVGTPGTGTEPAGPSLVGSALATVVLFLLSLIVGLVFGGELYASPFLEPDVVQQYFVDHPTMVRFVALLQFASAVALAAFTGQLWARLRRSASTATGPVAVAAIGGVLAATLLALNSIVQWVLTQSVVNEQQAITHALNFLFFALGGYGHVATLGLLVAGTALAAKRRQLLPGWMVNTSFAIAVLCGLSTLTMLTETASPFIPIGRFLTLVWLVGVAYALPRARRV